MEATSLQKICLTRNLFCGGMDIFIPSIRELTRSLFGCGRGSFVAFEKMSVEAAGDEIGIFHNFFVQWNGGLDPLHDKLIERARHARDGFGAVIAESDKFC